MNYYYIVQEKGEKMKAIYFDMDGTIADLYGYEGWLEMLQDENTEPYEKCGVLVDVVELKNILDSFVRLGVTIGVISWSAMGGSKDYNRAVRKAKLNWCQENFGDVFTEFHVVKYGTPKHHVCKIKESILVDDNDDVRDAWHGETVDAKEDIVSALKKIFAAYELDRRKEIWSNEKGKIEKANDEGLFSDLFWENHTSATGLYLIGQTTFNPITNEKRYWVKVGKTTGAKSRINSYLTHSADVYFIDWYSLTKNKLSQNESFCQSQLGMKAISRRTEWFRVTEKIYFEFCEKGFNSFKLID